jgi:hypothetical protein
MAYSSPRRFNWVTTILLLALAGGGYWLWKFFPIYFTAWQVDHALSEGTARTYSIVRMPEPSRSSAIRDIEAQVQAHIVALGISDPEMSLRIEMTDRTASAVCDYTVVVQHALVAKTSAVHLHRTATTDLKRVDW